MKKKPEIKKIFVKKNNFFSKKYKRKEKFKNFAQYDFSLQGENMSYEIYKEKNLLEYSETQNRATLVDFEDENDQEDFSVEKKKNQKNKQSKKKQRKGLTVNNGKIVLRIPGYRGIQSLAVSELVHFIPISKLKVAGNKLIRKLGVQRSKIKKGKKS